MSGTLLRLRHLASLVLTPGGPQTLPFVTLDVIESGTGRLLGVLPEKEGTDAGTARVEPGDVLFGKLRPYLAKSWLVNCSALASTELLAMRSSEQMEARFLGYVAQSMAFVDWAVATSEGTKMPRTSWEAVSDFRISLPCVAAQRAIADYLDAETARIDALIEKKQRMIALLEEREQSRFVAAVMGPADQVSSSDYDPFSPSNRTSLRHLQCEVQTGPFGSQLHAEDYVDDGWPVVNPMSIVAGHLMAVPGMSVTDAKRQDLARHILIPGDIVFGRRGEMGRAALVGSLEAGWLCGTGSLRVRLADPRLSPAYLKLLLETPAAVDYFTLSSVGSTMDNLNTEILLAFPVLLPPRTVQEEIVREVALRRSRCRATTAHLDDQLRLLAERRQALITTAVTGELATPGVPA